MIPDAVHSAAHRALESVGPVTPSPTSGKPGDVAAAFTAWGSEKSHSIGRLVAVLRADERTKTVMIHLVTNETEQATDLDLIVRAGEADAPFDVVIQSELYAPLFTDQVRGVVGHLDEDRLRAIESALVTDGESLEGFATGSVLAGPEDPRRAFKEQELTDLRELAGECRRWLAGEPAPLETLDPELLLPPPPGTSSEDAADQFIELLDVLAEREERAVPLPSEIVALLAEADLLEEITRWRSDFGLDAARVLACFTISDAADDLPPLGTSTSTSARRRADVVLDRFLESQADVGNLVVDIRTARRCWSDSDEVRVATARSGSSCRARARLVKAA